MQSSTIDKKKFSARFFTLCTVFFASRCVSLNFSDSQKKNSEIFFFYKFIQEKLLGRLISVILVLLATQNWMNLKLNWKYSFLSFWTICYGSSLIFIYALKVLLQSAKFLNTVSKVYITIYQRNFWTKTYIKYHPSDWKKEMENSSSISALWQVYDIKKKFLNYSQTRLLFNKTNVRGTEDREDPVQALLSLTELFHQHPSLQRYFKNLSVLFSVK